MMTVIRYAEFIAVLSALEAKTPPAQGQFRVESRRDYSNKAASPCVMRLYPRRWSLGQAVTETPEFYARLALVRTVLNGQLPAIAVRIMKP